MVDFHPAAIDEASQAHDWYEARNPEIARSFLAALDEAVESIAASPALWPNYLYGTHRYLMHRFPFLIVYRPRGNDIQVVAVAHGHRKPGYWRDRL